MQLFVQTFDAKLITLGVMRDEKIENCKAQIARLTGLPADQQRLNFGGKQLEDPPRLRYSARCDREFECAIVRW